MTDWATVLSGQPHLLGPSMRTRTTFHCEAKTDAWVCVASVDALGDLVRSFHARGLAFRRDFDVVGNGSNLLVRDGGYRGALVSLDRLSWIREIEATDVSVRVDVGAGTPNGRLLQWARDRERGGFEFSFGIPGTVGGGVRMNAGTPAGWFGEIVRTVTLMDAEGELQTLAVSPKDFAYRDFPMARDRIVVSCEIELASSDAKSIEGRIDLAKRGRAGQPLEWPNFGSVFRNPEGDHAGRLIEAAGLKGRTRGAAQISAKHANFIVNLGGARTQDALDLIADAKRAVRERFNIELTEEVVVMGEA